MTELQVEKRQDIQLLTSEFLKVVQQAATAVYPWIGRGDKNKADGAATKMMRDAMGHIDMDARIVIGEGEMDEAPMLYIGERLGTGNGSSVDIAVDPVEGTTLVSKGQDNSLAVIAVAKQGTLLHAPDMYMEKIAVGTKAKGSINLNVSLTENMKSVALALGKDVSELTVMIQDRPRHDHLIKQVYDVGAKVRMFSDVDITGAISTAIDEEDVDLLVGTGGAPEGVIAAVALKCLGGDFQGRLVPENDEEFARCIKMGIADPLAVLTMDEIVKTDACFFVATGITNGSLLKGVRKKEDGKMFTHSFIATKNHSQFIEARH
ncbi:class II fructose-bisphosphatase [Filibacter tadaridae]|uniref:class II fructose-bisphosphatase n=1 Tax=Filibacter tadaridae TaxID=2483811 RepID=UPI000F51EEAC|nr:class II fructose-bisphosphatase [Filibacter tadaridae]